MLASEVNDMSAFPADFRERTKDLKVAIVHYWLVNMRGGEKVVEALLDLFPQAVIITHVYDRDKISDKINAQDIRETFVSRLPGARKHYQKYLPFMPRALEQMDLQEFDLVISSESGPAKGIIPRPDATHLCYCHSPMRYIWDHYHAYRASAGRLARLAMPSLAHRLRIWDVTTAMRVDRFAANSGFVSQRIKSFYRREADVIFPPVACAEFAPVPAEEVGDHYLLAGELVAYKRPDLAVDAFTQSGRKLVVVGDGEMRASLEARAGSNVTFMGRVPFAELKRQFASCRALVFPGEEDFGIVPVEVMASGRPVVAYASGGALDTVIPGVSGVYFDGQTVSDLNAAIEQIEASPLLEASSDIRAHALKFDEAVFQAQFAQFALSSLEEKGTCRRFAEAGADRDPA
ncbi:glycosyltransferase [Shimia sp. MMG029]|uniref:glycosyltransferase n=1 Tax=Shimia sp. MMG029 TaxID=3021978 RepID=UPI0022FEC458|nr:glycosyltransferase [Shimia sp. MMG029]MDA5558140.1 glycosyltransferase [Shimia sp. MMG029]